MEEKNDAAQKNKPLEMTQDEYFNASEERKHVTPENIAGLLDYPALFKAMGIDRELRPALSAAMSTGRAMNDFLTCSAEEFGERYVIAEGPKNPKTGKPFGTDTKAYLEWASQQTKTPVTPEEHAMFGNMAKAYSAHAVIASLNGYECTNNAVFGAEIGGVMCLAKVDKLYVSDKAVIAVDVKTTADLQALYRSADSLRYREQQAFISMVLHENGISDAQVFIAAVEKGPIPRCGVFGVKDIDSYKEVVYRALCSYGDSLKSGVYGTNFESLRLI